MFRTRVKICGITRVEDALLAAQLGADAIGFILDPQSPRFVSRETVAAITAILPPFITTVGVVVDLSSDEMKNLVSLLNLDLLQFHGTETPEYCGSFGIPYIKAIHVQAGTDIERQANLYPDSQGILLDAYNPTQKGGTGIAFDWNFIPQLMDHALILAGGLNSNNVADAINKIRPYAVDVSSGVEISPGIKNPEKMAAFIAEVRRADSSIIEH